jgi:alcohol dehydrogenase
MALDLVRPGGTIAAIGVFCDTTFNLNLADVFLRNISLHMNGFANAQPLMWQGLRLMSQGIISPEAYFSHRFALDSVDQAFRVFGDQPEASLKVMIRP